MSSGSGAAARAGYAAGSGRHARQRIAAAIDFGTHGSGFAWAFASEQGSALAERRLVFHDEWVEQPVPFVKTRTALLTDGSGTVLEWGHPATRRFKRESQQRPELRLRQGFKMELPGSGDEAEAGPDAVSLVAAYLRELYRYAVERICAAARVREDEIRWGVTVPAIWRDRERDLMRRAAVAAGMPADPRRLLILEEPVVATQYCYGHLLLTGDETGGPGGRRILVVDAGGGTVDITSFEIGRSGSLTEVGYASGGPHGGMHVDKAFLVELLSERIGAGLFQRLRAEQPETVLQILDEWERQKRHFDPSRGTAFNLDLPTRLYQTMQRDGQLKRFARRQDGVDHLIVLSPAEVSAAFDRAVEPILGLVDEHLERIRDNPVDHVFLVGGFAQSPYLHARLRDHLAGRADTLVPPNPASAVLAGAVHFVLDPAAVVARKSPRTYGIATNLPFEDGVDPPHRVVMTGNGRPRLCADRFSPLVRRDDQLPVGVTRQLTLYPLSEQDTTLEVVLLSSDDGVPRYADDPAATVLGEIQVTLADPAGRPRDYGVVVTLTFGGSEVLVAAAEAATGRTLSHQMSFARLK